MRVWEGQGFRVYQVGDHVEADNCIVDVGLSCVEIFHFVVVFQLQ